MRKLFKALLPITLILCVAVLVVHMSKDTIILYRGIRVFRLYRNVVSIIAIIFCIATIGIATYLLKIKSSALKKITESYGDGDVFTESERKSLYNDIRSELRKRWPTLSNKGVKLLVQLDSMNDQQNNLRTLLRNNNSEEVADTMELLQKLEDCMYVNIRKLLNYVYVIHSSEELVMKTKIKDCHKKNATLLTKAKEFSIAVADYINSNGVEGDEDKSLLLVQSYKDNVLETLDQADIYLN